MAAKKTRVSRKPVARGGDPASIDAIGFQMDRTLINVLGEEHYPYAEFLYHELAANAWDEDATEVHIAEETVRRGSRAGPALYDIRVADNGNGMDADRLREYFRVGGSAKRHRGTSERLGRPLIGRIGVGKVSILKVARQWTLATERHLGLNEPARVRVEIAVDDWIEGRIEAFPVEHLDPVGTPGTEIILEGVTTRFREDRILRHLQRLPLSDTFRIWRNGVLIPPRQWHGVSRIEIAEDVEWTDNGKRRSEPIRGEIWIRPYVRGRKQTAFVKDPKDEQEALERDPAGIEVRVNNDMIAREFFDREDAGHGVNRIWGWVEAPWLPILGNRTDYLRDSPAGQAFREAMRNHFDEAFRRVKAERETPRKGRRRRDENEDESAAQQTSPSAEAAGAPPPGQPSPEEELEPVATRFGKVLNELLDDRPEFAPVVEMELKTERGRPAKDRIYPVRPAGETVPFQEDLYGDDVAIESIKEIQTARRVAPGHVRRRASEPERMELGERVVNTRAGIRLRFSELGEIEAPYRWALEDPDDLALDINLDHPLYPAEERPGSAPHRLHCAWVVSLALAERRQPAIAQQLADFTETVAADLFQAWAGQRWTER